MLTKTFENAQLLGEAAGHAAALKIEAALHEHYETSIILATGTSQIYTLQSLAKSEIIDWSRVNVFHLDEYIGIGENHEASFRLYLKKHFTNKVGTIKNFYPINGNATTPQDACDRLNNLINKTQIDVALIGIGENGHLAFNDPPADFDTRDSFISVASESCCFLRILLMRLFAAASAVAAS